MISYLEEIEEGFIDKNNRYKSRKDLLSKSCKITHKKTSFKGYYDKTCKHNPGSNPETKHDVFNIKLYA